MTDEGLGPIGAWNEADAGVVDTLRERYAEINRDVAQKTAEYLDGEWPAAQVRIAEYIGALVVKTAAYAVAIEALERLRRVVEGEPDPPPPSRPFPPTERLSVS